LTGTGLLVCPNGTIKQTIFFEFWGVATGLTGGDGGEAIAKKQRYRAGRNLRLGLSSRFNA